METVKLIKKNGHILCDINSKMALIDTGSPISLSDEDFEFLGDTYSPPANMMGVSTDDLAELAGFRIDILIGLDILSRHTIRLRLKDSEMDIGNDIPDGEVTANMADLMGMPVFPLSINKQNKKALLDTGAHLSYINPELVYGMKPIAQKDDFHPMSGSFNTAVYSLPTALDDDIMHLEYGVMKGDMHTMLDMAMKMSGTAAVIGTDLMSVYDCKISWQNKKISWTKRPIENLTTNPYKDSLLR